METVRISSLGKMQMLITTEDHALVADEPPEVGDGLGPNPYQLLLAALGT